MKRTSDPKRPYTIGRIFRKSFWKSLGFKCQTADDESHMRVDPRLGSYSPGPNVSFFSQKWT